MLVSRVLKEHSGDCAGTEEYYKSTGEAVFLKTKEYYRSTGEAVLVQQSNIGALEMLCGYGRVLL